MCLRASDEGHEKRERHKSRMCMDGRKNKGKCADGMTGKIRRKAAEKKSRTAFILRWKLRPGVSACVRVQFRPRGLWLA